MKKEGICPTCSKSVKWIASKKANIRICSNCRTALVHLLIIRITKTPAGQAPEWVRKSWVGLKLLAEPLNNIDATYMAPKDMALDVLSTASLEAVAWYATNFPRHLEFLTFALDEAEVVEENSMIASQAFLEGTILQ